MKVNKDLIIKRSEQVLEVILFACMSFAAFHEAQNVFFFVVMCFIFVTVNEWVNKIESAKPKGAKFTSQGFYDIRPVRLYITARVMQDGRSVANYGQWFCLNSQCCLVLNEIRTGFGIYYAFDKCTSCGERYLLVPADLPKPQ